MIFATIERTHPTTIPAYLIPALMSGRMRALVRPLADLRGIRPGDALWVREGITVAARQRRRDTLELRYAGERRSAEVPWMPALAKPGAGYRPPEGMPIQTSRLTLLVEGVEHARLAQVEDATAIAAGAEPDLGGYGALGFPMLLPFHRSTEALGFLLEQECGVTDPNPEVTVVQFRAVARNIERLRGNG